MQRFDAVIVGAGAAGLHCAAIAGQLGLRVLLIDHATRLAEKIRISGGGRCNFTNREVGAGHFLSENPHYCRSALARYTPADFISLLRRHGIAWHEKHKGQLFCDRSSEDVITMLVRECEAGGVTRWQPCHIAQIAKHGHGFTLETDRGAVQARRLVIATGGLSIPKIGASDFGYRLARQFGHRIVETRPALVPLTFDAMAWRAYGALAGLSQPVHIATGAGAASMSFAEDLLFTHRGLSGPAILQISSYWQPGCELRIDLAPGQRLATSLLTLKQTSRRKLANELAETLPRRLAEAWLAARAPIGERTMPEQRAADLQALAASLHGWTLRPAGTEGYRKAEVTAGGIDTRELNSRTMQSERVDGLYFIGEVVDVTGWLGGYNFQWAWASAAACAHAMAAAQVPEA